MSKDLRLSEEDLLLWGSYLATKKVPKGATQDQIKRLANRQINLGDASAVATLIHKINSDSLNTQINMLLGQNATLEQLLRNKLGVTEEDFEQAEEDYNNQMAELIKELQEQQAAGEE